MPKRKLKAHYYHKKPFKVNWAAVILMSVVFGTLAIAFYSTQIDPPKSNLGTIEKMEDLISIERVPVRDKKD